MEGVTTGSAMGWTSASHSQSRQPPGKNVASTVPHQFTGQDVGREMVTLVAAHLTAVSRQPARGRGQRMPYNTTL